MASRGHPCNVFRVDPIGGRVDPGLAVERTSSGGAAHLALAYYYYLDVNCTTATCQFDVGFIASPGGGASWDEKEQLAGPMQVSWFPVDIDFAGNVG